MTRSIASIISVAGLAAAANAQSTTLLSYEVSRDGLSWDSTVDARPGDTVQVRARVQLAGGGAAGGIASMVFQPVVRNVVGADAIVQQGPLPGQVGPFGGNFTTPSGGVPDAPGVYGRIFPFCGTATTSTNYIRSHLGTGTAAGMIRIAQAQITNWIGEGPTSGTGAINNVKGGGGVNISQAFNSTVLVVETDVIVFKFGIELDAAGPSSRALTVTTP